MRLALRVVLGVALGGALLWLALSQVDLDEAGAAMLNARADLLALGLAFYWCDIAVRVLRWRTLLKPTKDLRAAEVGRALVVGYAVNNVLPARLGEIFRADYLGRHFGLSRAAAVGSIIVERLLDGAVVVALFGLGIALVSFKSGADVLVTAALLGAVGVLVITAAILLLPSYYERLPFYRVPWLQPRIAHFVAAIGVVRTKGIYAALLFSALIWALECSAILMVVDACGVALTLPQLFVVVGAASLSTLLPSAPGYIGSLQIAYVAAFAALGEAAEPAIAAATLTQVVLLGSITLFGLALLAVYPLKSRAAA